ncbi:hypothetical protein PZA11_002510 [Diplocarpon coronariae]
MILGELDAISLETGADTGSWKFEDYGQRLGSSDEEQIFRIAIQFGKRLRLSKASFLGALYNMRYFDLRNLFSSDLIMKRILLLKNSISYKVLVLIDTSANRYALINLALLKSLSSFFKPLICILPIPFLVKGYNGS